MRMISGGRSDNKDIENKSAVLACFLKIYKSNQEANNQGKALMRNYIVMGSK